MSATILASYAIVIIEWCPLTIRRVTDSEGRGEQEICRTYCDCAARTASKQGAGEHHKQRAL